MRDIDADLDEDGLSNFYELLYKSDPLNPDTDGDGVNDGAEVDQGTLPGNPADGNDAVPTEELCVLRITVGSHTSADDCWGGTSPSDDAGSLIQYDPIHGPASGEHDKRDQHWTVTIGGAGAGGLNGGVPFALSTQPDGGWGQFDLVVRKGQCIPMHMAYGGPANGSQNSPHFSLHVIPVDHRGGQPCTTCCCLRFDHGDPDVNGTRTGAMPFFGSACNVSVSEVEGRTGYVCLPLADIDIDSDNNNELHRPDRTRAEELIESDPTRPGQVVWINNGDRDSDGVQDWSDGYNADHSDSPNADDILGNSSFAQVAITIAGVSHGVDDNDRNVTLSFPPSGSGGQIRLWRKNAGAARDFGSAPWNSAATSGDQVRSGVTYTFDQLGLSSEGGTLTLYAEGLAPSTTPGDISISMQVGDLCTPDVVRLTAVGTQFLSISKDAGGELQYTPIPEPVVSFPTPVLNITNRQTAISNLRLDSDNFTILADLQITGTIDDAASDLTEGASGKITFIHAALNGTPLLVAGPGSSPGIPVTVSKAASRAENVLATFDYSGTFSASFSGVRVLPGANSIRVAAINRFGFAGYAEFSTTIDVQLPPDDVLDVSITVNGQPLYYNDPSEVTGNISIHFTKSGGGVTGFERTHEYRPATMAEDGIEKPGLWVGPVIGSVVSSITIDEADAQGNRKLKILTLDTPAGTNFTGQEIVMAPAGGGATFDGQFTLLDAASRTTLEHSTIMVDTVSDLSASEGDTFRPFAIQVLGPSNMLSADAPSIALFGRSYDYDTAVVTIDDLSARLLSSPDSGVPTAFFMVPHPDLAEMSAIRPPWPPEQDEQRNGKAWFCAGYAAGLWDNIVVSVYDGVVDLAAWSVEHSVFGISYKMLATGDPLAVIEAEGDYYVSVLEQVGQVAETVWELEQRNLEFQLAVYSGDSEKVSRDINDALAIGAMILEELEDHIDTLDDYEKGKLTGEIMGTVIQVVLAVVPGANEAVAASLGSKIAIVAEKLNTLPKFAKLREILGADVMAAKFAARSGATAGLFVRKGEELLTTKMCFIAGTPVWAANGLVAIETLCPGDLVLSRDEHTGEQCFKPIADTIVTHPAELWSVEIRAQCATSGGTPDRITGTAEHPFWVVDTSEFVPMSHLRMGQTLLLAHGGTATVMNVAIERGPPPNGAAHTTYNFEVDEFHTYFVGHDGVWVHNQAAACERFLEIVKRVLGQQVPNPTTGRRNWLTAFEGGIRRLNTSRRVRYGDGAWDLDASTKVQFVKGLGEKILEDAAPTGGAANPAMSFSYDEWVSMFNHLRTNDGAWGRVKNEVDLQINHASPKEWTKIMWERLGRIEPTEEWLNANTPGFPIPSNRHARGLGSVVNGNYQPTFHDLLNGNASRGIEGRLNPSDSTLTAQRIRRQIKDTYSDMQQRYGDVDNINYSRIGDVTDAWLATQGVP